MLHCESHWIFNRLFVGLRVPRGPDLGTVRIRNEEGTVVGEIGDRTDVDAALRQTAMGDVRIVGRVFSKQHLLVFLALEASPGGAASPSYVVEAALDGITHEVATTPRLTDAASFPTLQAALIDEVGQNADLHHLVRSLCAGALPARTETAAHIDVSFWESGYFFVHGWLREHALEDVLFTCDGVSFLVNGRDCIRHERPDVRDYLKSQGFNSPHGGTGFSLVLPASGPGSRLTVFARKGAEFEVIFDGELASAGSRDQVLPLLLNARAGGGVVPLPKLTRMMSPFFARPVSNPKYDVVTRRAALSEARPLDLSIVVPFYREWRFVFSLLRQIERAPEEWEWVFVCDDPTIFAPLHRMLMAQPATIRSRITLLRMFVNSGFAAANNVGAAEAGAATLLLMNSDVWFRSFASLEFGLRLLEAGRYDLLGFTLLFEDGTIQHDGMALEPNAEFDGLYLAQHPGKGLLPQPEPSVGVRDQHLVTGALMLLKKSKFSSLGGFSHTYIGGDFEDADLCLRIREAGGRIGIVSSGDVFHLERQSIRRDNENAVAFSRTLINCVAFNEAWAGRLGIGMGA